MAMIITKSYEYLCFVVLNTGNGTSRNRSPKGILSPGPINTSAFEPLALEITDFAPGNLL